MFDPMNRFALPFIIVFLFTSPLIFAQQAPFENEVRQISAKYDSLGWKPGSTLFTGSSTIRMWSKLQETYPQENLINTGFGGSKAADLGALSLSVGDQI